MPEITQEQLHCLYDTRREVRRLNRQVEVCRDELLDLYDAHATVEPGPLQLEVVSRSLGTVSLAEVRRVLGDAAAEKVAGQLKKARYLLIQPAGENSGADRT